MRSHSECDFRTFECNAMRSAPTRVRSAPTYGITLYKTDIMFIGQGKYIFEIGCEQHGEYIPVEMPGDVDDEDAPTVTIPKWKAVKVTPIISNN